MLSSCITLVLLLFVVADPVPQLDLPPLPPTVEIKPRVTANSYPVRADDNNEPDKKPTGSSDYDRDRSQRYGPPYSSDETFFRNKSFYETPTYNGGTPDSRDEDKFYADRNRYGDDRNPEYNRNRYGDSNRDDDRFYANRNQNYNPSIDSDRIRDPERNRDYDRENFDRNRDYERNRGQNNGNGYQYPRVIFIAIYK